MNLKGLDLELTLLSCNDAETRKKLSDIIAKYGDVNGLWVKKLYEQEDA